MEKDPSDHMKNGLFLKTTNKAQPKPRSCTSGRPSGTMRVFVTFCRAVATSDWIWGDGDDGE